MSVYFNFLNSNQYFFYTLIKVRLNYSFGSYFRSKTSIWSLNFFYHNLVLILENLMQSNPFRQWCSNHVKWVAMCQFLDFLNIYLFIFYLFIFFKLKKLKFATCRADIMPRGRDSATCHNYARCHFLILNLVPIF